MSRSVAESKRSPTDERQRRLRHRNWALLGALVGFVALVYIITIVRMTGG
ncbi:MAG TPA: hypothetical protein VGM59_01345 [Dongiaceae bacterium]|jgi:hypothetical protein